MGLRGSCRIYWSLAGFSFTLMSAMSPSRMNAVIATTAILYRVLPSESKLETTRPQTIGPINEDARSARLKYAKARLCFPLGAIEDINERETAQLEPNHNPMMVVATTNTTKFVASPMSGNKTIHPESMNKSVLAFLFYVFNEFCDEEVEEK